MHINFSELLITAKKGVIALFLSVSQLFGFAPSATTTPITPTKPATPPSIEQSSGKPLVTSPVITASSTKPATTNQTTAIPAKTPVKPAVVKTPTPAAAPISTPAVTPAIPPSTATTSLSSLPETLTFDQINQKTRDAMVNILCTTKSSGTLDPITGSGIIIDTRGVILTNAHIAQYFLLANLNEPGFVDCTIRTGSPATPAYKAVPLYVSSRWIKNNLDNVKSTAPKGTGEDDFGLLIITQSIDLSQTLPSQFPSVPGSIADQDWGGQNVLLTGYAAGFLGGESIQKNLFLSSALAQVTETLSYTGTTYDFLDISGSVVAQRGSSGGAVVNDKGQLIGLISTVTEATQTDARRLGAITLSHISNSLLKQTGSDLVSLLTGDIRNKAIQFQSLIAPGLFSLLANYINSVTPATPNQQ